MYYIGKVISASDANKQGKIRIEHPVLAGEASIPPINTGIKYIPRDGANVAFVESQDSSIPPSKQFYYIGEVPSLLLDQIQSDSIDFSNPSGTGLEMSYGDYSELYSVDGSFIPQLKLIESPNKQHRIFLSEKVSADLDPSAQAIQEDGIFLISKDGKFLAMDDGTGEGFDRVHVGLSVDKPGTNCFVLQKGEGSPGKSSFVLVMENSVEIVNQSLDGSGNIVISLADGSGEFLIEHSGKGPIKIKSGGDIYLSATGNISAKAMGDISASCTGNIKGNVSSDSTIDLSVEGKSTISGGSKIYTDSNGDTVTISWDIIEDITLNGNYVVSKLT